MILQVLLYVKDSFVTDVTLVAADCLWSKGAKPLYVPTLPDVVRGEMVDQNHLFFLILVT